ncbi:sigma-54-dependent Fis family transcriptional regulator [Erythrobacter sp. 3-20A1M]|uniref:sigma-54 interaction domain-containing protein n=1 Tax=Erythrobacter sp. 3-20A1M TaxID=2653850 RepID=UPI00203EDFF7|nr:sigma-54 dependent transcriptional regulator [Erythrobacter sp. 3-20A1M]
MSRLPGKGTIVVCDVASPAPARRGDDLLIVLERGEEQNLAPLGARGFRLTYADPTGETPIAALLAAADTGVTPMCADPASAANLMLAERVALSDVPVLIEGPSGTGKEVMARFIHRTSERRDGPFIAINCAAMPEAMLEAMLFGHKKGAFTGATEAAEGFFRAADGGTLLLDEIAEMPLALQAKLLRALQEGEVVPIGATKPVAVDVRVIACANRDLPQEVAEGRFRPDLYYRLNVFPIQLQALRERPGDIAPLAFAMMLRHATRPGEPGFVSAAALAKLRQHQWPGNVRELENVIRRALVMADGEREIGVSHIVFDRVARIVTPGDQSVFEGLSSQAAAPVSAEATDVLPAKGGRLSNIVRKMEAQAIADALEETNGNRAATARRLGISERTLRYRLADMREAGLAVAGAGR